MEDTEDIIQAEDPKATSKGMEDKEDTREKIWTKDTIIPSQMEVAPLHCTVNITQTEKTIQEHKNN